MALVVTKLQTLVTQDFFEICAYIVLYLQCKILITGYNVLINSMLQCKQETFSGLSM